MGPGVVGRRGVWMTELDVVNGRWGACPWPGINYF